MTSKHFTECNEVVESDPLRIAVELANIAFRSARTFWEGRITQSVNIKRNGFIT